MLNDKVKKAIREYLKETDSNSLFSIINDIYNETGELESLVWNYMDEFDEMCSGMEPHKIANCIFYGDFRPNDNYFRFDNLGNFESCDYIELDNYDIDEIIEAVETMPEMSIPSDIKDIIEEEEELDENGGYIIPLF